MRSKVCTPACTTPFVLTKKVFFSLSKDILKNQKETKTKEGKRRIVPIMLEAPNDFE